MAGDKTAPKGEDKATPKAPEPAIEVVQPEESPRCLACKREFATVEFCPRCGFAPPSR